MKTHLSYLSYILRHKWYVFVECCQLRIPLLGVFHDWSKFLPSEWVSYTRYFYGDWPSAPEVWRQYPSYTGPTKESVDQEFDRAWLHHQHWNKHHWQYWLLVEDEDEDKVLPMPDKYRREMLADWRGAGRALGALGIPDTLGWYLKNRHKLQLHPTTRDWVEGQLGLCNECK